MNYSFMTDFSIDWLDHSRVTALAAHAACGGSGYGQIRLSAGGLLH